VAWSSSSSGRSRLPSIPSNPVVNGVGARNFAIPEEKFAAFA